MSAKRQVRPRLDRVNASVEAARVVEQGFESNSAGPILEVPACDDTLIAESIGSPFANPLRQIYSAHKVRRGAPAIGIVRVGGEIGTADVKRLAGGRAFPVLP